MIKKRYINEGDRKCIGLTHSYSFEDRVKVDRGEEYRALFTFEALVNGKIVETKYG